MIDYGEMTDSLTTVPLYAMLDEKCETIDFRGTGTLINYSLQTALALFELSDLMPWRLQMTVPQGFRRNAPNLSEIKVIP